MGSATRRRSGPVRPLPHTTPEHMPLALKVALGVAGVWGAFALVNAVFRAKVASAVEGAVPGSP